MVTQKLKRQPSQWVIINKFSLQTLYTNYEITYKLTPLTLPAKNYYEGTVNY